MDNNKQCDGCQVSANVPYAAFEAVSARAERNIRRLALIIVFFDPCAHRFKHCVAVLREPV